MDLASFLYDNLINEKITKQQAAEIAQQVLENLPENTPDIKLEKPLVKLSYKFPNLSLLLKQYFDEIHEQMLDNIREQNYGSYINDGDRDQFNKIKSQLEVLAVNNNTILPVFSEGYLANQIAEIKDKLEIIPPSLIGAYTSENFRLLGLSV